MFMAKLAQDAGFPDGSVNIIHGSADSACLCEMATHERKKYSS